MGNLRDFKYQLETWGRHVETVRKVVTEFESTFRETLGELIQDYESQIVTLIPELLDRFPDVGEDVSAPVLKRAAEERAKLKQRQQELRDTLLPEVQAKVDACVKDSQKKKEERQQTNTELHAKQTELQERRAALERQLAQINVDIRAKGRFLGVVINAFAIAKLRKQRSTVRSELFELRASLHTIQRTWQNTMRETAQIEETLQAQWEDRNLKRGQYQAELNILDDSAQLERLALTQAARAWLDGLRTPVQNAPAGIKEKINALVDLNVNSDTFRDALGAAAQLSAVYQAVFNGMKQMHKTAVNLLAQEKRYIQYLPALRISMPTVAEAFHNQWSPMLTRLEAKGLAEDPQKFTEIAKTALEEDVSNEAIKKMFESLGDAINQATKRWG